MSVRLRPSAALIRDGAILLIEDDEPGYGIHYNLPGGGLEDGETLHEGLIREVREEADAEIEVGPLILAWESKAAKLGETFKRKHTLMLVFRCALKNGSEPRMPNSPERSPIQVGVRWVNIEDLPSINLLPEVTASLLEALRFEGGRDIFLLE